MRVSRRTGLTVAIAALAAAGLGTAGLATKASADGPATDCGHVYILTDGHDNGSTGRTWDANNTIAPPGAHLMKFLYDDGIIPVVEPHDLDTTQRYADAALEQQVVDFHDTCPGTHITLVGYSFGALISGNVIADLATKTVVPHDLLNAVLISDPRRAVRTTGVEGPAGGIMSVAPDGPGMHTTGPRDFGDIKVASICKEDDVICNAVNPISNAQGFIGEVQRFPGSHTSYGDTANPDQNPWHDPAAFENVGDLMLPPWQALSWGAPAFPSPMPRDLLNTNPVYEAAINGLSAAGDTLDWANILNTFGLPGNQLIHDLIFSLESNGQYW